MAITNLEVTMKKSSTAETSNQKSKGNVVAPSVMQQPPAKPTQAKPAVNAPVKAAVPANAIPADPTDAPMHAAQGNDDTMSQPQASRIGKKKS